MEQQFLICRGVNVVPTLIKLLDQPKALLMHTQFIMLQSCSGIM